MHIIKQLERNPFVYYAVEEGMECAKNNYYVSGILTFSQLLNLLNEKTPKDRHIIAHEILQKRPTKAMYEKIKSSVEKAADEINIKEINKHNDIKQYEQKLLQEWSELMVKLGGSGGITS